MRRRRPLYFAAAAVTAAVGRLRWPEGAPPASTSRASTSAPSDVPDEIPPSPQQPDVFSPDQEAARAVAAELDPGLWNRDAIARIRALVGQRSAPEAASVMRMAGIDAGDARRLGRIFASAADYYDHHVGDRTLLNLWFVRVGAADWELTVESAANLRLPFHPKTSSPLKPPPSLGPTKGKYERCDDVGRYRFASGDSTEALKCAVVFRDHRFQITTSTGLLHDNWEFADRLDHALSNLPARHLKLVREIVIDPGAHPTAAAHTSWDGTTVSIFLLRAGRDVAQEFLDTVIVHELGHVVSLQQDDTFWARWDAAIALDKLGVSLYGMTNRREDFAETYELYLAGGRDDAATRASYRTRFAVMDRLFSLLG